MRRSLVLPVAVVLTVGLGAVGFPARAALMSKTYEFKADVTLETGVDAGSGLRFDSVRFEHPSTLGRAFFRTGGVLRAKVQVSNVGEEPRKFGIAIALLDDEGRLLGVAHHGTTFALKAGRQDTYTLDFVDVNGEIHKATKFKISIEPKL